AETLDDGRVSLELLLPVRLGSPGRGIALRRDEILHAIRDPVQRPAPFSLPDLGVRPCRLRERALAGQGYDGVELRAEALQSIEAIVRQLGGRGFLLAQEPPQLGNRREREIVSHQSAPR